MRPEGKCTIIWALAGVAVGLLALWQGLRGRYLALIGFAVLFILLKGTPLIFREVFKEKKDSRWLVGNGIWPYLTSWYATWVFVYASLHL